MILDLAPLTRMFDRDTIIIVLQQFQILVEDGRVSLSDRNISTREQLDEIHKIKGAAYTVGAYDVAYLSERMEKHERVNGFLSLSDIKEYRAELQVLSSELLKVCDSLNVVSRV